MDYKKTSTKLGLGAFTLATLAAIGGVIYGRGQSVNTPRACAPLPGQVALLCDRKGPDGERVDRTYWSDATRVAKDTDQAVRLLPATDPCFAGEGVIDVVIDPSLDDQRLASGGPTSMPEDPAHAEIGGELWALTPAKWGITRTRCDMDGTWHGASVRLHPRATGLALTHEVILHGLGWVPKHPVFHPPTGHLGHEHRPSLDDLRGIRGGKRPDVYPETGKPR